MIQLLDGIIEPLWWWVSPTKKLLVPVSYSEILIQQRFVQLSFMVFTSISRWKAETINFTATLYSSLTARRFNSLKLGVIRECDVYFHLYYVTTKNGIPGNPPIRQSMFREASPLYFILLAQLFLPKTLSFGKREAADVACFHAVLFCPQCSSE